VKRWRIVILLLLSLVLISSTACNPFGAKEEETSRQLVEVVRGDLTVYVSGSGNIEVSKEARLAFGTSGKIDRISVSKGDKVTKDEVLAKLDTDLLELALTQAEVAVTQAQVAITQAEVALKTAEYSLSKAEEIYTWPELEIAQADVDDAESYLEYALSNLAKAAPTEIETWMNVVARAQVSLAAAEARLNAILGGYDTEEVAIKKLQVEAAKESLALTKQSLELARQSLELAQKQSSEATIIAPFDGLVTNVAADEGDTVTPITHIIHLIDLNSMELKAGVDEIDIPEVRPGQRVIISVDALPALQLEGEVVSIDSLPTIQAGLVLYSVTISFNNPEGSDLKVGMSATTDIIIEEQNNVLLVPNRAIEEDSQGKPIVRVLVNEQIQERAVVLGISDGLETEIVSGLQEGDIVVIETRPKTSSPGGFLFQD